jgi:splicing factor 3B subunit 2
VEIEVEYVAEEPDLADGLLADFKTIFDKFTFKDTPAADEVYEIQSTRPSIWSR